MLSGAGRRPAQSKHLYIPGHPPLEYLAAYCRRKAPIYPAWKHLRVPNGLHHESSGFLDCTPFRSEWQQSCHLGRSTFRCVVERSRHCGTFADRVRKGSRRLDPRDPSTALGVTEQQRKDFFPLLFICFLSEDSSSEQKTRREQCYKICKE